MKIIFFFSLFLIVLDGFSQVSEKEVKLEFSGFYHVANGFPRAFLSVDGLISSKNSNWKNGFRVDFHRTDLIKGFGLKNYISVQGIKAYDIGNKSLTFKSLFGLGLFNYSFTIPGIESRTNGLMSSVSLDFGFRFKKIDLNISWYLAIGGGWYYSYVNSVHLKADDSIKFLFIGSPCLKITLKNKL